MDSSDEVDLISPRRRSETISGDNNSDEEDLVKKEEKRSKFVTELLNSELLHVDSLQTLVVDYVKALKDRQDILSPLNHKLMFGNIEVILGWNMEFYTALKNRINGNSKRFGDILIEMFPILKQIYTQYSENYEAAQICFRECFKIKEFEEFVIKRNKNLLSMLYIPIQRMVMYYSLLKDIVSLTSKDHIDYNDLKQAFKQIKSIISAANRVKEKRKNMDIVVSIQHVLGSNVDFPIAEPHRSYVFEDNMSLVFGRKLKIRKVYLFNDMLLVLKSKKK